MVDWDPSNEIDRKQDKQDGIYMEPNKDSNTYAKSILMKPKQDPQVLGAFQGWLHDYFKAIVDNDPNIMDSTYKEDAQDLIEHLAEHGIYIVKGEIVK